MVRLRLARPLRVVVGAQCKLPRIRKVRRYIRFFILRLHRLRRPLQPRRVIVPWVASRPGILRRRQNASIHSGERPEVIVEAVILLDDDHHVLNRILRFHDLLLRGPRALSRVSHLSFEFVNMPLPFTLHWCTLALTASPVRGTQRQARPLRLACFPSASFPSSSSPSPSSYRR